MIAIVGAGMAGLLAANLLRGRGDHVVVCDEQASLPNNHSAVLRFRTKTIGDALGIPFRKVKVIKAALPWLNPIADSLSYSRKNMGIYLSDRSVRTDTEVVERWIAPPNLVDLMSKGIDIRFGKRFDFLKQALELGPRRIISTIPMPALMGELKYPGPKPKFRYIHGLNIRAKITGCDAYVSLAVPDPSLPFSRVSLTGSDLIVEMPNAKEEDENDVEKVLGRAAQMLGVDGSIVATSVEVKRQHYAKIAPVDDEDRRQFIYWASTVMGYSFSLGRFATWRPGLLLDDLVNDVRVIQKLMDSRSPYDAEKMEIEKR